MAHFCRPDTLFPPDSPPKAGGRVLRRTTLSLALGFAGIALALGFPLDARAQSPSCLAHPIDNPLITSNFGGRFHPVHRQWRFHNGADFRAAMFTRIKSAHAGMVLYSKWIGGGGNTVAILGDNGVQTKYMHLSRAFVQTGQRVPAGYTIADSGNTGESTTAPHLHFETRLNGGSTPADPRSLFCSPPQTKADAGPDKTAPGDLKPSPGTPAGGSPAPDMAIAGAIGDLNSMSLIDFLRGETERRFLNPQWMTELTDPNSTQRNDPNNTQPTEGLSAAEVKKRLWTEIAMMTALDSYIGYQKMLVKERIETLLATESAQRVKKHNAPILQSTRQGAMSDPQVRK